MTSARRSCRRGATTSWAIRTAGYVHSLAISGADPGVEHIGVLAVGACYFSCGRSFRVRPSSKVRQQLVVGAAESSFTNTARVQHVPSHSTVRSCAVTLVLSVPIFATSFSLDRRLLSKKTNEKLIMKYAKALVASSFATLLTRDCCLGHDPAPIFFSGSTSIPPTPAWASSKARRFALAARA